MRGDTSIGKDRGGRRSSGVILNSTSKHAFVGNLSGYVKQWMSGLVQIQYVK